MFKIAFINNKTEFLNAIDLVFKKAVHTVKIDVNYYLSI